MEDHHFGASGQGQSQRQEQVLTINVDSSSDPALEQRIFGKVHSVGRQLGRLSAVVELLLAAHQSRDSDFGNTDEARQVLERFREVQSDIRQAMLERRVAPERFVEQLQLLERQDPASFEVVAQRLRTWLDSRSG